jgi:hypothetical protein
MTERIAPFRPWFMTAYIVFVILWFSGDGVLTNKDVIVRLVVVGLAVWCIGRPLRDMRRLVEQHQVQGEVVQVLSAAVQVSRAPLDRLVGDRLFALGRDERPNGPLQQVLVDAAVFVQEPERRLEAMRERLPLGVRETLIIHAPKPIGDAHVAGLREKRGVVHEAPERQQAVHATGVAIVPVKFTT